MVALTDKIAVLYGGDSAEREVSLNSGRAVAKGLKQAGYQDVELIDTKGFELNQLNVMKVKHVFIALHGKGGEDGTLQGALEYLNIPYTGSGVLGSALAMDKVKCKQIWQSLGYGTADFIVVRKANFNAHECDDMIARLGGKVMVKPATEGSSIGMSIANSGKELQQALENAFDYDEQILVEAWINGLEYTVAILGDNALPAIRMETANEFYDYQAKYQSTTTQYHCPCGLSENDESALQTLALNAFNAVGVSVWGRVDVMRNEQGEWLLLEVNTVPGMTETSLVPKAAKVAGYSFSDLVHNVLTLSA